MVYSKVMGRCGTGLWGKHELKQVVQQRESIPSTMQHTSEQDGLSRL
jgi:hypothetical protein